MGSGSISKVLVTGANGFIGRAVCRSLSKAGFSPIAGLRSESVWPALHAAVPEVNDFVVIGNLGEMTECGASLDNVTVIIHLAARVHIMADGSLDGLKEFRRVNVNGTASLARAAAARGVRRMVFVSTAKVNGESTSGKPFTEADPINPQNSYAVSKSEAERALRSISADTGLETVVVRPPLVYGPGVGANFLQLIRFVDCSFPIPLPKTNNLRSFVGVENLSEFLTYCVSHPRAVNQTFLISDGEDVSTRELVSKLAAGLGHQARFLPVPECALRAIARLVGKQSALDRLTGSLVVNSGRARELLQWAPPVTLDGGLAATVRWYQDKRGRRVA